MDGHPFFLCVRSDGWSPLRLHSNICKNKKHWLTWFKYVFRITKCPFECYLFISFRFSLIQLFIALLIHCLGPSKKDIGFKKKASLFVCLFYQGTRNWSCCRLTIWYKDLFTLFQTIELTRIFWSLVSLQSIISQAPFSGGQQALGYLKPQTCWLILLSIASAWMHGKGSEGGDRPPNDQVFHLVPHFDKNVHQLLMW